MHKSLSTLACILICTQLSGCFTAVVGGAAAGGLMITDRRTSGIYIEDQNIELKVGKRMYDYMEKAAHVNTTSFNRVVLLTGEVPSESQRQQAETLTREISNVREIHNALTVGPASSLSDRGQDAFVTSKVKTRFISEGKFSSNAFKVVTEAGTVYLMGIVTEQEATEAVEIARTTEGVAKVVKVFEYIK